MKNGNTTTLLPAGTPGHSPKLRPPFGAYVRSVTTAADAGPATEAACALASWRAPPPPGGCSARTGRMRTPGGRRAAPSQWKDLAEQVSGSRPVERERAGAAGVGPRLRNLGKTQSAPHPEPQPWQPTSWC